MDIAGEHDTQCHTSYLYYPQYGLPIEAAACADFNRASQLESGNIMPGTSITIVSFVEMAPNSEIMLESFNLSEEQIYKVTSNLVNWSGYGYYPP
jgi:hypothetical protein